MNATTKSRMRLAALNAAAMIDNHTEAGLSPEDVGEENQRGLLGYKKACNKVAKMLTKIADEYK